MNATVIAVFSAQEEYEAALQQGGRVELLVADGGGFKAKVTQIALSRLRLLRGEEWLPRVALVSVPSDSVLVILPNQDSSLQIWGGIAAQPGELLTVGPNARLHVRSSQRCRWGVICISARALERYGYAVLGSGFSCPPGIHSWQPSPDDLRSLTGLFNSAINLTEAKPARPVVAPAAHGLEQELIQALINCLRTGPRAMGTPSRHRHSAIMSRVEDMLQIHSDRMPRVAEICAGLSISRRTLFACCKEQVGMSPSRYFRLSRMRRVHRTFTDARAGYASVSHLATSHGFKDLGRFAAEYRKLFGELPSATLRKNGIRRPAI